jgi:hypothetical protein
MEAERLGPVRLAMSEIDVSGNPRSFCIEALAQWLLSRRRIIGAQHLPSADKDLPRELLLSLHA